MDLLSVFIPTTKKFFGGQRPAFNWPLIKLIRRMQEKNPLWSPQRIQGELAKLGFTVCDNTVHKYPADSMSP